MASAVRLSQAATVERVDYGPIASLRTLLERAFPEASDLDVVDRTGGGDHFQVSVRSDRFRGLSLVDQHRLVYDALAEPLQDGTIHELRIKTKGE
jgi:stress-induced morphogen